MTLIARDFTTEASGTRGTSLVLGLGHVVPGIGAGLDEINGDACAIVSMRTSPVKDRFGTSRDRRARV